MEVANSFGMSVTNDQFSRHHISVDTLYIAFRMMEKTTKTNVDIVGITDANRNNILKNCVNILWLAYRKVLWLREVHTYEGPYTVRTHRKCKMSM
jgi:hypothetical protein